MDIDEKIYRNNGFRILGLDITSKNNKIKNRLSKVDAYRNRMDFDDSKPLEGVFDKSNVNLLLPVYPSPSYIDFQNAKNRLNDARIRLIDEILWLWPKSFDSGLEKEVVDYLKDKDYNGAISYWETQAMNESLNTTSIHNLAVLYHAKSLDIFINDNINSEFLNDLELGLNYWANTISDSSNFKNFVKQRVNSLNNPRLTEEYVDKIFEDLPYDLLNINLIIIKRILNSSNFSDENLNQINKLIKIIQNSSFNELAITNISSRILEFIDSLINKYKDSFETDFTSASDKKFEDLFYFRGNVLPLLSILKTCFDGNSVSDNIRNNTCMFILNKMIILLDLEQSGLDVINEVLDDETKIIRANEILATVENYSISENIKSRANSLSNIIFFNGIINGMNNKDESNEQSQIENSFKELNIPYTDNSTKNKNTPKNENDFDLNAGVNYLVNFIKIVALIVILSVAYFVYCLLM